VNNKKNTNDRVNINIHREDQSLITHAEKEHSNIQQDTYDQITTRSQTSNEDENEILIEDINMANINNTLEEQLNDNLEVLLPSLSDDDQQEIIRILMNEINGDTLDEKESDTLRVMFQNIKGLRPNNTDKWEATINKC
jgi:hypothetical protein